MFIPIKKADDELQVVYGEVYAPGIIDAQGDTMSAVEVRKMAYHFLAEGRTKNIDTNHDNERTGSYVVESFIAEPDSTTFLPGSWVVGVHIPSVELWGSVKKGELNGFSLQALVKSTEKVVELELPESVEGITETDDSGHQHTYTVKLDDSGQVVEGRTSVVNGHFHKITKNTVVEKSEEHSHRFSVHDALRGLIDG